MVSGARPQFVTRGLATSCSFNSVASLRLVVPPSGTTELTTRLTTPPQGAHCCSSNAEPETGTRRDVPFPNGLRRYGAPMAFPGLLGDGTPGRANTRDAGVANTHETCVAAESTFELATPPPRLLARLAVVNPGVGSSYEKLRVTHEAQVLPAAECLRATQEAMRRTVEWERAARPASSTACGMMARRTRATDMQHAPSVDGASLLVVVTACAQNGRVQFYRYPAEHARNKSTPSVACPRRTCS